MTSVKVEFAKGCFDEFEGTQEELDNLIEEIKNMAASGQLLALSELDLDGELDDAEELDYRIVDIRPTRINMH